MIDVLLPISSFYGMWGIESLLANEVAEDSRYTQFLSKTTRRILAAFEGNLLHQPDGNYNEPLAHYNFRPVKWIAP